MVTIQKLLADNFGVLKTSVAKEFGIHSQTLKRYVEKGLLFQEGNGVYSDAQLGVNEFYLVQQKYPQGIFSRKTALSIYGLNDEYNFEYDLTFKRGYHNQSFKKNFIRPHFSTDIFFDLGKETYQLYGGEMISIYNIERTLVDIWNPRYGYDKETKEVAVLRIFSNREYKIDMKKLVEYGEKFRIGKALYDFILEVEKDAAA
ncbi:Transcriptional regulator, AbiEi antitoxin, Type IV TA system [Pilibacter termitis]|uniref:Transcriptional regulator, AbiEi antitoxin, Type IV TA system n=1 Tax=Pilibacter termitis TaxID=263852 RepID=A0A1T4KTN3_9ENTE|nr:type IV toxin-antitoxin system AbiEi family antitoxin domain-containing protein [Pilibacter termitis]SJZ45782.1 Transcriptional regulator, AbiEi antitoxin, Type IV TA system [Pilibacter termitis]